MNLDLAATVTTHPRQVLTFVLDGETFALPIDRVREVVEFRGLTRVPRARPYVRGLLNLRGNVVPVVDLRSKLGMGETPSTVDTCVIVVELELGARHLIVGALADAVREVKTLDDGAPIEGVPEYGLEVPAEFLQGIVRDEDTLLLALEPDRLFTDVAEAFEDLDA